MKLPSLFSALCCTCFLFTGFARAQVVLTDPFTHEGGAAGTLTADPNTAVPGRQAGGLVTTSYTPATAGDATNSANLEESSVSMGSDCLLLRTKHLAAASSQSALKGVMNLGTHLTNSKWQITFRGRMQRAEAGITDGWLACSVGDSASTTGPNNASADFAMLVSGPAGYIAYGDNAQLATGAANTLKAGGLWDETWTLTLIVDELLPQAKASAVFVTGGVTTNLGPWNITFDNATTRTFELRAHQTAGAAAAVGSFMDARVDDLAVTILQAPPSTPVITTEVAPRTVWVGDPATFSVQAVGQGTLIYEWRVNGELIIGATSPTLTLSAAALANAGTVQVKVSGSAGSATSSALLTVVVPTRQQRTYEEPGPSSRRTSLTFSEIMFHPAPQPGGKNIEFLELTNSDPYFEDLSGYEITGDVNYTFPPGTQIPSKGRLVIAAMPADVASTYSLSGVLGPWTGSLSNEGGTVRLRKKSGAVVLESSWQGDSSRWPAAADGAGHSLVLAHPSYGEDAIAAYEASAIVGGSPGASDPVPGSPQDFVVINEILAHTSPASGLTDFIELYNAGPLTVDISGCWLSDDPDELNKLEIPPGTQLAPYSFYVAQPASFSLRAAGETVYFSNPSRTRVLDAVRYDGLEDGVSAGRIPNGEGAFRLLSARTPGASNAKLLRGPVVVSEIMFNPLTAGGTEDEWLELTNRSAASLDLSGWKFTDGVDFTFPAGTTLAPGAALVVAKNAVRTRANHPSLDPSKVLGDYGNSLSNNGERIQLSRPVADTTAPGETFMATVDEVIYADGSDTSRWADGGGSSLELTNLDGDPFLPSNWADSDETAKAPWTTVEITGKLELNNPGVPASAINQVQLFLMGEGEALVDDVEVINSTATNVMVNGGFESGQGSWVFQGNQNRSSIATTGALTGTRALTLRASDRGGPDGNRVRCAISPALTSATNATLRAKVRWLRGHPEIILRLRGGWLETLGVLTVPANLGTPGAANSRAIANALPDISGITTRPVLPLANVPFRVMARAQDRDGVTGMTLRYRVDPSAVLLPIVMRDDGTSGDIIAGDGVFTCIVPQQSAGALVAFRCEATDGGAVPATATFPASAPASECLSRVGDVVQGGDFAAYRLWMTSARVNTWTTREKFGNEPVDATFVYANQRIIYGVGNYYGGSEASTPGASGPTGGSILGYHVLMPRGTTILRDDQLLLDNPATRDPTGQREQLMFWFLDQLKLPNLHRRYVHLFFNGVRRAFLQEDVQRPGGQVLEEWFRDDSDGWLFKTNNWSEVDDAANSVAAPSQGNLLRHYDSSGQHKAACYRWNWCPRATDTFANMTPFYQLIDAVITPTGATYEPAVRAQVDTTQWMRTFAMNDLGSYWDGFGNGNKKNSYLYKPQRSGWQVLSWDFDVGLGVFGDSPTAGLFDGSADPQLIRMNAYPAFRREYWRTFSDALGTFFSGAGVTPFLQSRWTAFQANGITATSPFVASGAFGLSIPQWVDQRRAYLISQMSGLSTVFSITAPANDTTLAVATVTLSGRAPVSVATLYANDRILTPAWSTETTWTAPFTLLAGVNDLVIRGVDGSGTEIARTTLRLTFTGTNNWPALKINEWMASNNSEGTVKDPADNNPDDWFELYNPTPSPVALTGWTLTDTPGAPQLFTIPAGVSIPANGRLTVWADDTVIQTAPGQLHVPFKLSGDGEMIALFAPDGTLIDSITFASQAPNVSSGRVPDGGDTIDFLVSATPGNTNAAGAGPVLINMSVTPAEASFTIPSVPGFLYRIEATSSLDAPSWSPLQPDIRATGPSLMLSDPAFSTNRRRFYRAIRTP
jgi:hypothetical protein